MRLCLPLVCLVLLAGCVAEPRPAYGPGVDADDLVDGISNPWLPYRPGSTWVYEAATEDGTERVEVLVTRETRMIMGVAATVVRDAVTVDGVLVEDTFDWFAEDRWGNVWYLGEDSKEYEDGVFVGTEGSWEWGVDGALPGVVMWAEPVANNTAYFQEFYWGEAVDEAAVVASGGSVTTPAGTFEDTVTTREWTRLEPGVEEMAHYARGVGVILKEVSAGEEKGQREALVSYEIADP